MLSKLKIKDSKKLSLYLCVLWLLFIFIFSKHYIDLSETIETWMVYKGLAYWKDIAVFHFPLGRIVLLPIHWLFNWSFQDSPFIGLGVGITTLTVVYLSAKNFLKSTKAIIFSIFFYTFLFWYLATQVIYDHEMMMGLFYALSLLVSLKIYIDKKVSSRRLLLLGLFLGVTIMTGQLSGITVGTHLLLVILFLWLNYRKVFMQSTLFFLSSFAIPWLLVILYATKAEALSAFYHWNFLPYYLTYAKHDRLNILLLPWREILIYYSPFIVLGLLMIKRFLKTKRVLLTEALLFILVSSTIPFNLFSVFHYRHLLFSLPLLALTAGYLFEKEIRIMIPKYIIGVWLICLTLFLLFVIVPYQRRALIYPPTVKLADDSYPGEGLYEVAKWIKTNTPENTKIMVLGNPLFFVKSDRVSASRPNKGIPYSWQPIELIKKELLANEPDYWIIDNNQIKRLRREYQGFHVMNFIDNEMLICYKQIFSFDAWSAWKKVCNR